MVDNLLPVELSTSATGGTIAVLTLVQSDRPVIVIDQPLLEQLNATLDTLPGDLDGFVLASGAPRAFVAGADLKSIMSMNDDELHTYLEYGATVFQRIADLPCPTAAAIHSVALGGGLELAMHCDALVACVGPDAKPFLIGLPEAGLKICPGWGGTNLLAARIDPKDAIIATATGVPMKSDHARAIGLFDAVVESQDELIEAAKAWVATNPAPERSSTPSRCIDKTNRDEIASALERVRAELDSAPHIDAVLDCVQTGINKGWSAAIAKERGHLVALRHTEPAQDAINAFFAKSKK